MDKRKTAILVIFTFASGFALSWGLLRARAAKGTELDYRVVYIGARCLIQHCDPYNPEQVMDAYFREGGKRLPVVPSGYRQEYLVAQQLYPPSAELFFAPFSVFSWPVAYSLWAGLTLSLVTLSALLMWSVAIRFAVDPPFYLGCILLANSGILFAGGNPAGVAVGFCIVGVWCLVEARWPLLGVFCLAISLAIKPHDSAFVWLYLVLLGGVLRKRALQALSILAAIAVAAVLWVRHVSPNWMNELRANVVAYSAGGSQNDPASGSATMMVNLQPIFALFRNEPAFYNLAAYAICAPLLTFWVYVTLRSRRTREQIWLGLAAAACLILLPLYHRPHDAKILLLTLPACAVLCAERGPVGWTALALTSLGILVTSDLPIAALNMIAPPFPAGGSFSSELFFVIIGRPAGLVLLCVAAFYLWAYSRNVRSQKPQLPTPEGPT